MDHSIILSYIKHISTIKVLKHKKKISTIIKRESGYKNDGISIMKGSLIILTTIKVVFDD